MFEIKKRDELGRIGRWSFEGRTIETPAMAVVVNPNKMTIPTDELENEFHAQLIITNAYIIKQSKYLEEIKKNKLHRFLGWDKPIYTDSGTFQMYSLGKTDIGTEETVKLQIELGSDIITPLDEFTFPTDTKSEVEKKMKKTYANSLLAREIINEHNKKYKRELQFNSTVQGGVFMDCRRECARLVSSLNPDIISVGGIVPLMEQYRYKTLTDIILNVKKTASINVPLHAFGCGHPMLFSLMVLCGIDVFDSAAYALFAKKKKYITVHGTLDMNELNYLPCSCPVCSKFTSSELIKNEKLLAKHNLYVTLSELNIIKQAIASGTLRRLTEMRCASHPTLYYAYKNLEKYNSFMEKYSSFEKRSSFFFISELSRTNTDLYRLKKRSKERQDTKDKLKFIHSDIPYGLKNMFPVGQNLLPFNIARRNKSVTAMRKLPKLDVFEEAKERLQYQFGKKLSSFFEENKSQIQVNISKTKIHRIKEMRMNDILIGVFSAKTGFFIPTFSGACEIRKYLGVNDYCVRVKNNVVSFAKEGKSVFARHVKYCDYKIRPHDYVFVVDSKNNLLALGQALMNKREMKEFKYGVAVNIRKINKTGKE
ncbi:MAG: tRNA guanosine(15) transglycosylase TgtA [Candidatus Aenigmarchaeota archaeon]|nr:tRNA guanosine(15) transglycosylase TgtA [Candidatus Aenigmarchaeota archaeon]